MSFSKKFIKLSVIIVGITILISLIILGRILGVFEKNYTKQDLIENYRAKQNEIKELRNYIKKIVPSDRAVDIEFDGNRTLSIFHVMTPGEKYDTNWGLKVNDEKAELLLKKLGWSKDTLNKLKEKLDQANCISINSEEPITIGYQRCGFGKYYYKLFDSPLSESQKKQYNNGCEYIYFQDNVVLEYGGGAVGPQCFPEDSNK